VLPAKHVWAPIIAAEAETSDFDEQLVPEKAEPPKDDGARDAAKGLSDMEREPKEIIELCRYFGRRLSFR
jgi:hypothetical protein